MNIPYIKPILVGILLAAWAGSIWYAREDKEAEVRAEMNEERLLISKSALQAEQDKREQTNERLRIAEQVAKDAKAQLSLQTSKLAKYDDITRRLRAAEAAYLAAQQGRTNTSPSVGSTVSFPTYDLSTDMLGWMDAPQRATLEYADKTRIAHEACVAQYEQIRNTQKEKAP